MRLPGLGDMVASALSAVGITEERVKAVLGRECGCKRRKELLNSLSFWARQKEAGEMTAEQEHAEVHKILTDAEREMEAAKAAKERAAELRARKRRK